MKAPTRLVAPLSALACLLVCLASFDSGACSPLAAYSETRSFRDALEGRSMEEAISGPVDKDTSSYGERTAASPPQAASELGGARELPAGQMMLSIPANGNLNTSGGSGGGYAGGQQEDGQEQRAQEDSQQAQEPARPATGADEGGPELEREAGPIAPGLPLDGSQQQMMEQRGAGAGNGRQRLAPTMRNGRLSSAQSAAATATMMKMMMMRAKMAAGEAAPARSARQQLVEQPQGNSRYGQQVAPAQVQPQNQMPMQMRVQTPTQSKLGETGGFGDEAGTKGVRPKMESAQSYEGAMSPRPRQMEAGGYGGAATPAAQPDEQQRQQSSGAGEPQQQQERNYQQAVEQSTVPMQMGGDEDKMAAAARYSRGGGSRMAAATYENGGDANSRQSSTAAQNMMMSLANKAAYMQQANAKQRQAAPPMMQPAAEMVTMAGAGYAAQQQQTPSRGARRASQRRAKEKKMSPAMVNALLNKMMGGVPATGAMSPAGQDDSYGGMAGADQANWAAMGPDVLANMVARDVPANKRDEYKKLMVAAIMQQMETGRRQEYGGQQRRPTAAPPSGYGAKMRMAVSSESARAAPAAAMMTQQQQVDDSAQQKSAEYGNEAQPAQAKMMGANAYEQQQQRPMEMLPMRVAQMGARNKMPSYDSMRLSAAAGGAYGNVDMQQQQMMMMMARMQMTNGDEQAKPYGMSATRTGSMRPASYSAEQQQEQPMERYGSGAASGGSQQEEQQQRQEMGAAKMPRQQKQQPQQGAYGAQEDEQQQVDEGDGAAPMGMAEPYAFDYNINDNYGGGQYRKEESDKNGVVRGSYGYMDTASGIYRHVDYVADENGFRTKIKSNEPGLAGADSAPAARTKGGAQQTQMATQMPPVMQMQTPMAAPSSSSSLGGTGNGVQQLDAQLGATQLPMRVGADAMAANAQQQQQMQTQSGEEAEK